MKKTFALLMLATMLFSVGCGNQAQDAAKDAQQKVEQKADEAKAKVDEAKDKANQVADDAAKKADEMKADANAKVDEAKDAANKAADDANAKVDEVKADADAMINNVKSVTGKKIELGGVMPGTTVDAAEKILGEPVSAPDDDEFVFASGLEVEIDKDKNIVEELKIKQPGVKSADGVEVGMLEYALNEYCGPADKIEFDDGAVEYKYYSGDKKSKLVYKARNGLIVEIKCSLRD